MLDIEAVCELSGLEPQTLRNWVSGGVVTPAGRGGPGRGRGHRFSVPQAVGLMVAAGYRRTERGCTPGYAGRLAAAFGSVSGEWLEGRFRAGGTHLVAVVGGRPRLGGAGRDADRPDVRAAYRAVLGRAGVSGRRAGRPVRGPAEREVTT